MDKVNFKKDMAGRYNPKNTEWDLVDIPAMNFLMADGKGNPNTAKSYRDAVEALYSVAYAIKLLSRKTLGRDYVVPPLEGLWSADDPTAFVNKDKDRYHWTMMIMQPDWITRRCSRGLPRQRGKSIFRHCQKCGLSRTKRASRCSYYTLALTMMRHRN